MKRAATAALIGAWSQRRSKAFGFGIAACLSGALLFEDRVAPLSLHRGEPDPDPLTRFLKETPMAGGLWEVPDAFNETNAHHVLRAADHWKPLVNGYSGFQTPLAQNLHDLLVEGKTKELLDALEAVPVSYVTVRPRRMIEEQRMTAAKLVAAGLASHRLLDVRHFRPDDELYTVVKTEPRADVEVAVPHLGDCGAAGYEHVFAFQPGDEGEHELSVVFRDLADRVRHYPVTEVHLEEGALRSHTVTASARATSVAPRRSEGPPSAKSTTASSRPSRA